MDSLSAVAAVLRTERDRLVRAGTAERVTEILREQITNGLFAPGTRLSEEAIGEALKVSRNTLREAFRLLGHEQLVVHELNRGVFVRVLTAADVTDLYLSRQIVEGSALSLAGAAPAVDLSRLIATVDAAETAAETGDWAAVATLDLQFHQEIVALAGSRRLDDFMRRLLAELRLAFHVMSGSQASSRDFHEPYLVRNREMAAMLQRGEFAEAARALRAYLDDALAQLTAAGAGAGTPAAGDGHPDAAAPAGAAGNGRVAADR